MEKASKLIFLIFLSFSVHAEDMLCSTFYHIWAKNVVEQSVPSDNDKFKHCSISCVLSIKCGASDAFAFGVTKEGIDYITTGIEQLTKGIIPRSGTADILDILADYRGFRLVQDNPEIDNQGCIDKCLLIYPKNSCD